MAKTDVLRDAQTFDAVTGRVVDLPKVIRAREKLDTALDVRRAHARVFRQVRTGKLDAAEAGRLSYILMNHCKMIELSDLERRLEQLESGRLLPAP